MKQNADSFACVYKVAALSRISAMALAMSLSACFSGEIASQEGAGFDAHITSQKNQSDGYVTTAVELTNLSQKTVCIVNFGFGPFFPQGWEASSAFENTINKTPDLSAQSQMLILPEGTTTKLQQQYEPRLPSSIDFEILGGVAGDHEQYKEEYRERARKGIFVWEARIIYRNCPKLRAETPTIVTYDKEALRKVQHLYAYSDTGEILSLRR